MTLLTQPPKNKVLVWSEEFVGDAGKSPSSKIWNVDIGDGSDRGLPGWGNEELEYYLNSALTLTGSNEGGLCITAQKQPASTALMAYYGAAQYSSGKMHTDGKVGFKYGYIEVRAKMAPYGGTWPAIWLLGTDLKKGVSWPGCGEIDVMEGLGNEPTMIRGALHALGHFGDDAVTKIEDAKSDLSEDFHTYGVLWLPGSFDWHFDGRHYLSAKKADPRSVAGGWPFDQEFFLILNLAIGGKLGGEVDPALDRSQFFVDYIRHYSVDGVGEVFLH